MKFSLPRRALVKELDFLKPILPRSQKVGEAISGWLEVSAGDEAVTLSASNRHTLFQTSVAAVGDVERGRMSISPFVLDSLVRMLTDDVLHFESVKLGLQMRWSTGQATVREASSQIPNLGGGTVESIVTLPKQAVEAALQRVKFALPPAFDARIPGVLIEAGPQLRIVSIEGAAMAVVTEPSPASHPCTFLLPVGGHERMLWTLRNNDADVVTLRFSNHIQIECGCRTATTPKASGVLPPWERMLYPDKTIRADFPVDVAIDAVKRAILADEMGCARVGLRLTKGAAEVYTLESKESFAADYDGDYQEFLLKGKLLLGILEAMSTPRIELRGKSPKEQLIFQPFGSTTDQFVLMPMRDVAPQPKDKKRG
jgi:DNA polymerase III sliding clamp (beta) subunit (PCNA family)